MLQGPWREGKGMGWGGGSIQSEADTSMWRSKENAWKARWFRWSHYSIFLSTHNTFIISLAAFKCYLSRYLARKTLPGQKKALPYRIHLFSHPHFFISLEAFIGYLSKCSVWKTVPIQKGTALSNTPILLFIYSQSKHGVFDRSTNPRQRKRTKTRHSRSFNASERLYMQQIAIHSAFRDMHNRDGKS